MTPEERAEARRRIIDLARCLEIHPALLQDGSIPDTRLRKFLFSVPADIRDLMIDLHTLETERDAARAQVETLAKALREWLAAEDEFASHMENANTETWSPNYGTEHWERYQQTIASARAALKAIEG